jgi:serine/threonine protein kinase/tetratricopeptide (TPR) repeat protein
MPVEQLGKYKIISRIGRGAMGEVWKAHDPILGREVAVKTISASLGSDNDLRQRFHREAQAAARLNHPNIITIFEYGEEHDIIYMAMELLEGADLRNLIGQEDLLPTLDDKLDIMEQICDGLAFAHSHEIIHRDLKPGNIHVQPNGQVKILDFGLARLGTSEMTRTGTVMGTPHYMSPEQVLGDKVELSSDVFSIGAVFYELLSNHKPFDGDSAHAVLFQVVNKLPDAVRKWSPGLPPVLVDVVERAMMKDRKQRFHDAAQLREALAVARRAIREGRGDTSLAAEVALNVSLPKSAGDSFRSVTPKTRPPMPTNQQFADGTAGDSSSRAGSSHSGVGPPSSRPPASRPGSSAPRLGAGRTSPPGRSGRGSMPGRSNPPTRRQQPSRVPLYGGIAAVVVALAGAGGYYVWQSGSGAPAPAPSGTDARVGVLTEALASTQVELAKRDLDDKNYESAAAQADRALKLSPGSPEAREIKAAAQQALKDLNAAAAEAKAKLEAGNMDGASEALGRVLALDPKHPVATELSAKLNSFFQHQAEDAKSEASRARAQAERSQASGDAVFRQADASAKDAEQQLSKGEFAVATQGFLDARDTFDRARRAAEAQAREAARAAEAAAAPEAERGTPQRSRPAVPAVAAPATTLAATLPAGPPPKSISLLAPRRPFVAGETVMHSASDKKGPAGFDTEDVNVNPEFRCQIRFEASPPAVRPGEDYTIRIFMLNKGDKTLKIRDMTLTTSANGSPSSKPSTPQAREVPGGGASPLADVSGSIDEGVTSWSLDAVVSSPKGDVCSNRITWK